MASFQPRSPPWTDRAWEQLGDAMAYGDDRPELIHAALQADPRFHERTLVDGSKAIHIAAREGRIKMLEMVLNCGGVVDAVDEDGETAAMHASLWNRLECLELLVQHNADLEAQDEDGCRALSIAAEQGHIDVVRFLIAHGAIPDPPTQPEDKRPLACAERRGHAATAAFLRSQRT